MNDKCLKILEQIRTEGAPSFRETAAALLDGSLLWSQQELDEFLDGYMNDPYLTRND